MTIYDNFIYYIGNISNNISIQNDTAVYKIYHDQFYFSKNHLYVLIIQLYILDK